MKCHNCFSWQKFEDKPRGGVCRLDNTVRLSDEGCQRPNIDGVAIKYVDMPRNYFPMRKLKRDVNECQTCGRHDLQLETHHIIPRAAGGSDNASNLAVLCKKCHARAHLWLEIDKDDLKVEAIINND